MGEEYEEEKSQMRTPEWQIREKMTNNRKCKSKQNTTVSH